MFFVRAEENTAEEKLNETILDQVDKLELDELEKYLQSLGNFTDKRIEERLLDYIRGEEFDYTNFWNGIFQVLFQKVQEILPSFSCIAAVTLLLGILSSLKSGSISASTGEIVYLIGFICALIPLLAVLTECLQTTMDCVVSMQTQMQLIFPLMLTLMAATGGALSIGVSRPAVAFFSSTIVTVISKVVLPFTIVIIALSIAGNCSQELKISKFGNFFKSINKWVIGICVSVFGLFFTLQGMTAATYDGIVRRAAKYALGNGIPIIGGFLSGGFDLAVAGGILIKNALGSMSIFLMLFILFEPLILLISVNLLLRFTSAITQPFGDSRVSTFLTETADNLNYCTASLLFTAFMYFLSIIIMIASTEALI